MASLDELRKKVDNLIERHKVVAEKKAKLQGQLEAKKAELLELGNEIKSAGFDPRNLKEQRDKAKEDLERLIRSFEKDLVEAEEAIAHFEKK